MVSRFTFILRSAPHHTLIELGYEPGQPTGYDIIASMLSFCAVTKEKRKSYMSSWKAYLPAAREVDSAMETLLHTRGLTDGLYVRE